MDSPVSATSSLLLLLTASALSAQQPAEQALEAGARVERVTIIPNPIQVSRGDTAVGRLVFEDADGQEISGVSWDLEGGANTVTLQREGDEGDFLLSSNRPGSLTLHVVVQVPGETGQSAQRRIDSVGVSVKDWPVARIEIESPDVAPYVGTTFKLDATAFTARETENRQAKLIWRTGDPCRATVTPSGVVRLLKPGKVSISALVEGVKASQELRVVDNPVNSVTISPGSAQSRTGDPVSFRVVPFDGRGESVDDVAIAYSVVSLDSGRAEVSDEGVFVAEDPGAYRVLVTAGLSAMTEAIVQVAPRPRRTPITLVGRGGVAQQQSTALGVFVGTDTRDYALTGTRSDANSARVYVWDVTRPTETTLVDSVLLGASEIHDIQINSSGTWAAVARSGGAAGTGITFLDLSTPEHPTVAGRLDEGFEGMVPRVWITDAAMYAVDRGSGSLRIVDVSSPDQARHVADWALSEAEGSKRLFDVWGDSRYLYLAYGEDGLVVLDVAKDGSPLEPSLVSRHSKAGMVVRSAFRDDDYVYLITEPTPCFGCGEAATARVEILNVSNITEPKRIARFTIPEADARDIWADNGVLHVASSGGIRLVDVTGRLMGDLYRQGRELASFRTVAETEVVKANTPNVARLKPFKGYIFASDENSGLWVVRHDRAAQLGS